ncbi:MAG: hypothetical protein DDT31_01378 [Syntrophomonadaceae bacterium]|nr:hypothetical protein [Bacillota bacterium]
MQNIPNSGIKKHYFELPLPERKDQRPDTERIADGLGEELHFPLSVLREIPSILRKGNFKATVTIGDKNRVIDIELGNSSERSYGVALDIGTATIATYLLNLNTGKELGVKSTPNPQVKFGTDVISRIKHVHDHGEQGLRELGDEVKRAINLIIEELCHKFEVKSANIYKVVIVGNPIMLHLLLGIDPSYIDHSPYIPVLRDTTSFQGRELQISPVRGSPLNGIRMNPEGEVYILSNVSGYLGADIIAGVLYTELHKSDRLKLLVDIGTNGEIVLGNKDRILACSTAAGPAFEGARIEKGMSAQTGAISHVYIDDEVRIEVIGDGRPMGICGSGLVDAVGELLKLGFISENGIYQPLPISKSLRLLKRDGQYCFLLVKNPAPIYLTQRDVRELQLAKGAIRAGIGILIREIGATEDEIEEVFLAGAFGNFLRTESVIRLGLLPDIPPGRITLSGNSAGEGAKLCLIDKDKLNEIQQITTRIEYLELSYRSDFNDEFALRIKFPKPS